jgi:quercetin dioxygenase-like cupin family protein
VFRKGTPIVTRKSLVAVAVGLSLGAVVLVGAQDKTAGDPLDPIRVAPDTHRVAFENMFVRVLEVHIPSGKTEPRHRHPHGLSVYFTDWSAKVTVDGREPQVNQRKTGTFAWSDAVIHTVENTGKSEGHVLRIELKY